MITIKWADDPCRHERRRRLRSIRMSRRNPRTKGAFGATPLNTAEAKRRKDKENRTY